MSYFIYIETFLPIPGDLEENGFPIPLTERKRNMVEMQIATLAMGMSVFNFLDLVTFHLWEMIQECPASQSYHVELLRSSYAKSLAKMKIHTSGNPVPGRINLVKGSTLSLATSTCITTKISVRCTTRAALVIADRQPAGFIGVLFFIYPHRR